MPNIHDRTIRVLGKEAFKKIQNVKICILGLGGVGSYCFTSLARCGVQNFLIVDGDEIDQTNINRQEFAFHSTIGKRKVDVAENFIHDINPDCNVKKHDEFILTNEIDRTIQIIESYKPDWIIDALDSISIKLLLAEHFVRDVNFKNYISAMGCANKVDTSKIKIASLYTTRNDGLCRVMRKEARKRQVPDFSVCYSDEECLLECEQAVTRNVEKKILGSLSFIPSIMGITIAGQVVRKIANK